MVPGADLRTWQQNMPAGRMIGTVVACTCMNCTMLHMAYTDAQLTHRHVCMQGALLSKKERKKQDRALAGPPWLEFSVILTKTSTSLHTHTPSVFGSPMSGGPTHAMVGPTAASGAAPRVAATAARPAVTAVGSLPGGSRGVGHGRAPVVGHGRTRLTTKDSV